MNPTTTNISIIIPTHNRSQSTRRLLDKLGKQTYPKDRMEVVVVANDCQDDTLTMLQQYQAPYKLISAETNGSGPATPRNKGASLATGDILIFLDDDVDPSEGLAAAHVQAHEHENSVVIGYLPLAVSRNPGYYRLKLKMWWENKFQQMRKTGYRFGYEDLLSGNFSVGAGLFHKVNGFVTTLSCRDDYELGIRLLNAGGEFRFCKEAAGLHCDEVTDVHRSLRRKREEGKMDIKLWRMHPGITNSLQNEYRENKFAFINSRKAWWMLNFPKMTDRLAGVYKFMLNVAGRLRMRNRWHWMSYRLHTYWYYRGLIDQLQTKENLFSYFSHEPAGAVRMSDIDLSKGFAAAQDKLDRERPHAITIWFGSEKVTEIPYTPGMEPLRGVHLKRLLATTAKTPVMKALALRTLNKSSN